MKKNNDKLTVRERLVAKAITPIIDKLLHSTYNYFCEYSNIPFTEENYNLYCNYILTDLKTGGLSLVEEVDVNGQ